MKKYFEYLLSKGIVNPPDVIDVFRKINIKEILEIAFQCYMLAEKSAEKDYKDSVFNFAVNSSMSGGIHPCANLICRTRNVFELATFNALYADKLVILNPFEHVYHHIETGFDFKNEKQLDNFIDRLLGDIVITVILKPLFESKLITINPALRGYCKPCLKKKILEEKTLQEAFDKIEDKVISDIGKNVKVTMDTKNSIVFDGKDNYLGAEAFRFIKVPASLKQFTKFVPYTFNPEEIKKLGLWEIPVVPIFNDVIMQKFLITNQKVNYLTNRKIESDIISYLNANNLEISNENDIFNGLTHKLPFVMNASLEKLVDFRNNEAESFDAYRLSVKRAIELSKEETKQKIIEEISSDIIKPELKKLSRVFKTHQKKFTNKGKEKIIFNSLLLSAGLFANNQFGLNFENILALGGLHKLSDIGGDFIEASSVPDEVINNDYYFLWQIQKGL
ncbi:hypothetical protein KAU09_03600 [Candidatus Parcubacteria bacterium]|nr:hypothetical protein [Candidatus Parcubacteria bacterium]